MKSIYTAIVWLLCSSFLLCQTSEKQAGGDLIQSYPTPQPASILVLDHDDLMIASTTPTQTLHGKVLAGVVGIPPVTCGIEEYTRADLVVQMDFGDEYRLGKNMASQAQLTIRIELVVQYGIGSFSPPITNATCMLTIDATTPTQKCVSDLMAHSGSFSPQSALFARIFVESYSSSGTARVDNAVRVQVSLPNEKIVSGRSYGDQLYPSTSAGVNIERMSPMASTVNDNPVTLTWHAPVCLANYPFYQLQILRLYNEDPAYKNDESKVLAEVDWRRALMLETASTQLTLTLAEGEGYYLWRVRPVGNYYSGAAAQPLNWGMWTPTPTLTNGMLRVDAGADPAQGLFFYQQFDNDRNWAFQRSFSEGAKMSERIDYASELLEVEQSQQRLQSQSTKVISQTLHDYSGRTALVSLPVPVTESGASAANALLYRSRSTVMTTDGLPYAAEHFDKVDELTPANSTYEDPAQVDGGDLYNFYSNIGPELIPNAEGYPFSRTQFNADGTGTVKEAGGAGAAHRIGAGHTVRVLYGSSGDEELIRLFGDEAPSGASVRKVVNYDQNTTGTVRYIAKDGRVLATGLIVNEENSALGNLDETTLFDYSGATTTTTIRILDEQHRDNTPIDPNGWTAGRNVVITARGPVTLNYEIDRRSFYHQCLQLCSECDYHIEFKIFNLDDFNEVYSHTLILEPDDLTFGVTQETCNDPGLLTTSATVILDPGAYRIERRIFSNTFRAATTPTTATARPHLRWTREVAKKRILAQFDDPAGDGSAPGLQDLFDDYLGSTSANSLQDMYDHLISSNGSYTISAACGTINLPFFECPKSKCEQGDLDFEAYLKERIPNVDDRFKKLGHYFGRYVDHNNYKNPVRGYEGIETWNDGAFNAVAQSMIDNAAYNCDDIWDCWTAAVDTRRMMENSPDNFARDEETGIDELDDRNFNLLEVFLDCTGRKLEGITASTTAALAEPWKYFHFSGSDNDFDNCVDLADDPLNNFSVAEKWEFVYKCWTGSKVVKAHDEFSENDLSNDCLTTCAEREAHYREAVIAAYRRFAPGLAIGDIPLDCIVDTLLAKCVQGCADLQDISTLDQVAMEQIADFLYAPMYAQVAEPQVACPNAFTRYGSVTTQSVSWAFIRDDVQTKLGHLNELLLELQTEIWAARTTGSADLFAQLGDSLSTCLAKLVGAACSPTADGTPAYFVFTQKILARIKSLLEQGKLENERIQLTADDCELVMRTATYIPLTCNSEILDYILDFPELDPDLGDLPCAYELPLAPGAEVLCTNICLSVSGCAICVKWLDEEDAVRITENQIEVQKYRPLTCKEKFVPYIRAAIAKQLDAIIRAELDAIEETYYTECAAPENIREDFTIDYRINYYHFTLYYYDRAGNLVRTVPPAGVDNTSPDRNTEPAHTYVTSYRFNSLRELTARQTPDAGRTEFVYNDAGQLRFSQNAEQAAQGNKYSYTKYDPLARIIEVGQSSAFAAAKLPVNIADASYPSANTEEVTKTTYSQVFLSHSYQGQYQRYVRNRISCVIVNATDALREVKTLYSYDPHGNVEWVMNHLGLAGPKFVAYDYDLISGNVLKLSYNAPYADHFFHRYCYDEDNRLTEVWTSDDDCIWDRDALYEFYEHGPLRRVTIGEDQVQGVDLVYTLQGWLKGINHPDFNLTDDPGQDGANGQPNANVARDAFGMMLGYYKGDFKRSGSAFNSDGADYLWDGGLHKDGALYNGNIASWASRHSDVGGLSYGDRPTGYTFAYDQLNRLKASTFSTNSGGSWSQPAGSDFNTAYSYDGNGNITSLLRYGDAGTPNIKMDDLSYEYYGSPSAPSNKLRRVTDQVPASRYTDIDIDNQTSTNNYIYDGAGNLTRDLAEGITIDWTVYGKVAKVTHDNGKVIDFVYDGAGNRVKKVVTGSAANKTTYYIRDARGSVMATYQFDNPTDETTYVATTGNINVEFNLYGSERMGLYRRNYEVTSANVLGIVDDTEGPVFRRRAGRKAYELKDHLGNVRVIVCDVKNPTVTLGEAPFAADVLAVNNYYPFGMLQPERSFQSENYRYGFNDVEKDDEIKGSGKSYNFGARLYDPRAASWLSVDPLFEEFPSESPYSFAGNNPVYYIDSAGMSRGRPLRNTPYYHNRNRPGDISQPFVRTIKVTQIRLNLLVSYRHLHWVGRIREQPDNSPKPVARNSKPEAAALRAYNNTVPPDKYHDDGAKGLARAIFRIAIDVKKVGEKTTQIASTISGGLTLTKPDIGEPRLVFHDPKEARLFGEFEAIYREQETAFVANYLKEFGHYYENSPNSNPIEHARVLFRLKAGLSPIEQLIIYLETNAEKNPNIEVTTRPQSVVSPAPPRPSAIN